MSTRDEKRDEMRADNLETAYGAPEPDPHPTRLCRDCRKSRPAFGPGDLCIVCHQSAYGPNHYPTALRVNGPSGEQFKASCPPPCPVLDGQRLTPHDNRDDAIDESRTLHREAVHGPRADGWRYSTGRGWFATNAEGI